jgi:hypothetical protein
MNAETNAKQVPSCGEYDDDLRSPWDVTRLLPQSLACETGCIRTCTVAMFCSPVTIRRSSKGDDGQGNLMMPTRVLQ